LKKKKKNHSGYELTQTSLEAAEWEVGLIKCASLARKNALRRTGTNIVSPKIMEGGAEKKKKHLNPWEGRHFFKNVPVKRT